MNQWMTVAITFAVGGIVFVAGWFARRIVDRSKVMSAEELAEKIVREAQREAETQKKAAILEAKDEWYKAKAKFEDETQQTRSEIDKRERQMEKREGNLGRKVDFIEKKEKELDQKEAEIKAGEKALAERSEKLSHLIDEQNERLERIAGMNRDDAKKLLIKNMESEARLEAARMVKDIRDEARRQGDKEAKEILTLAIQRCAADHVVESTVSVVNLPSDEMKGRIIGREGRNIRAFETATGIDVIVDDTPEAVILSGFDPAHALLGEPPLDVESLQSGQADERSAARDRIARLVLGPAGVGPPTRDHHHPARGSGHCRRLEHLLTNVIYV